MKSPRACTIDGVTYPSQTAAAAALGLTRQRIHQLATQVPAGPRRQPSPVPVTIDDVVYPSVAEAAKSLGVSYWAARYFAKTGRTTPPRSRRTAKAAAGPSKPPLRNAAKTLRRIVVTLDTSIWIARLPLPRQRAIAKARRILMEQECSLREPAHKSSDADG